MKRVIAATLLVAAAVLAVAVNSSAGKGKGHHPAGKTITVVEHADTDAVTNGDPNNDVVGHSRSGTMSSTRPTRTRSVPTRDPVSALSWAAPGSARGRRSCHRPDHRRRPVQRHGQHGACDHWRDGRVPQRSRRDGAQIPQSARDEVRLRLPRDRLSVTGRRARRRAPRARRPRVSAFPAISAEPSSTAFVQSAAFRPKQLLRQLGGFEGFLSA